MTYVWRYSGRRLQQCLSCLQLNLLQKVLFWWQDLSQSCGRFSTTTSSSECCILVTRSFSIMWRIFYNYIFFKRFFLGFWWVIHRFGNWSSYPPFWESGESYPPFWDSEQRLSHQFRNLIPNWRNGGYNCENGG